MAKIVPTADPKTYVVGQDRAVLTPNRACNKEVAVARALPGTMLLVHGVNDVGVCYPAQEQGLCVGLNERLSRADLHPSEYRLPSPKRDDEVIDDPDAVFFRRGGGGYGPVIPFYWGYREAEEKVNKKTAHGQHLDRHGNRLDKNGAQGGGPFANATSNLPDMWDSGFKAYGGIPNLIGADPTHPLRPGPDRRYLVWAAVRLAALVEAIRSRQPDDTVTLIGHSQGCLVSLLAQALLMERGQRRADCLILNHPPYSLEEPGLEKLQTGMVQQTTRARLATLIGLVKLVTDAPHRQPALAKLAEGNQCHGLTGPRWTPTVCQRPDPKGGQALFTFAERDNRGKVYLYFCPEDLTVGLDNVIGIGSFGVPETVAGRDAVGNVRRFDGLPALGNRFFQRIFTMRERNNCAYPVGQAPGQVYPLLLKGEEFHQYAPTKKDEAHRHEPELGETRRITGEALTPPFTPYLQCGESSSGQLGVDPIDAAVAVTNGGIGKVTEVIDDPDPSRIENNRKLARERRSHVAGYERRIEETLNAGKEVPDRCTVISVAPTESGQLKIVRFETPNEARKRWQSQKTMSNSYHSAIVANPEHGRNVHAYDVAIGQGRAIDNPTFRDLLLKIADWRVVTKKNRKTDASTMLRMLKENPFYAELPDHVKKVVEANAQYYTGGTLPIHLIPAKPPSPIVCETLKDVADNSPIRG